MHVCILIISPEIICKIFLDASVPFFLIGKKVSRAFIPSLPLPSFFAEPSAPGSFSQKMTLPLHIEIQLSSLFHVIFPSLQYIIEDIKLMFFYFPGIGNWGSKMGTKKH